MSNSGRIAPPEREQPPPSVEPWLVVCLLALLPAVLIVVLPHEHLVSLLVPIIGSIVLLFAIGLVMLWRATSERRGNHRQRRETSEPADRRDVRRGT